LPSVLRQPADEEHAVLQIRSVQHAAPLLSIPVFCLPLFSLYVSHTGVHKGLQILSAVSCKASVSDSLDKMYLRYV